MSTKNDSATQAATSSTDAIKDENGRLPADFYTADCIGGNITGIFKDARVPKEAGEDILHLMIGEEVSQLAQDNPKTLAQVTSFAKDITSTFTGEGATLEEVKAGVLWVQKQIASFDDNPLAQLLKAMQNAKDNADDSHENLH